MRGNDPAQSIGAPIIAREAGNWCPIADPSGCGKSSLRIWQKRTRFYSQPKLMLG